VYHQYIRREIRSAPTAAGKVLRWFVKRLSPKEACNLWIERKMFSSPLVRRVLVNSPSVKRAILERYSIDPETVHAVYNGVDLERYSPELRERYRQQTRKQYGLGDDAVILFVANNFRLKGLRCLLKAMAHLRQTLPRGKALIVGKGRIERERRFARKLGVEHAVTFVGPSREPERFYGAADVLAHPTFNDPCSNVCMEALACGLPVLTTAYNGMHELMTQGREGYVLADPANTTEMAERLADMVRPDRWPNFSQAAYELGRKFSIQHNYQQVMHILREVLEEKS